MNTDSQLLADDFAQATAASTHRNEVAPQATAANAQQKPADPKTERLFEALRSGTVPAHGVAELAVGLESVVPELERALALCEQGTGAVRFLRGHYGCGKTFVGRLTAELAERRNFVTSFVVVSDTGLQLHRLEDLYRAIATRLSTKSCDTDALREVVDRWVASTEARAAKASAGPVSPANLVASLKQDMSRSIGAGTDLADDLQRVIEAYVVAVRAGDHTQASAVISWLAGSTAVDAQSKRTAHLAGRIEGRDVFLYLRGLVEIARSAGYAGMVVVVDETETLLRSRSDVRDKAWNAVRQIVDSAAELPGLLWFFTGTPDLFDGPRGFATLEPLHARVRFTSHAGSASVRQPQIALDPLSAEHLRKGAHRLRALYPSRNPGRRDAVLNDAAVTSLLSRLPNVEIAGAVPREFFRTWVEWLDLAETRDDWTPPPPESPQPPAASAPDPLAPTAVPEPTP